MLSIGKCGLHIQRNALQNNKKASNWNVIKDLSAVSKTFHEGPSRQTDFEKLTLSTEANVHLPLCTATWIENAIVAKKAQEVWSKILELLDFRKNLPKSE